MSSQVASFTDAWIETPGYKKQFNLVVSHLLQMRGLKLFEAFIENILDCRIFYRCVD